MKYLDFVYFQFFSPFKLIQIALEVKTRLVTIQLGLVMSINRIAKGYILNAYLQKY